MSVFTGGPYGRLAIMLNTLSSLNIDIIITIITSVSSKFTDFLLLTDVCQQHIFRIFAIDFHNLSFPQTTNRFNIALRKHVYAIYCVISRLKNDNFQVKNCYIFLIFAQNIDCTEAVLTRTHNLCLRAKIRK